MEPSKVALKLGGAFGSEFLREVIGLASASLLRVTCLGLGAIEVLYNGKVPIGFFEINLFGGGC
jgi:hypothetical protein